MERKKLVIFNVDDTLFGDSLRSLRPHAIDVVRELGEHFELAMWTQQPATHAEEAAREIGGGICWKFLWG